MQIIPYYQSEPFTVHNGDCRTVMQALADCSVDAIVCDPPYELGFMSKNWDRTGIAYDVNVWRECLRVLKPGGHLLAFGGSRTYHRLACAIEDAGFEIRDQIQWIYSSGFPKSLNVSKNLREEESVCTCNDQGISDRSKTNRPNPVREHPLRCLPGSDLSEAFSVGSQCGEVLQPRLSEPDPPERWTARPESEPSGRQESGVEGRGNGVQEEGQLHRSAICESTAMGAANGSQGRLHHGASTDHGSDVRLPSHANGSRQPLESQPLDQRRDKSGVVADERGSQTRGVWPLCSRCGKPIFPEGVGSALKPAHEPIVLARKPFDSTLIQNVLCYGTDGLNINGCRIEGEYETRDRDTSGGASMFGTGKGGGAFVPATGRWPSNVCHDGSEEVLAGFPETESGALRPYSENHQNASSYQLKREKTFTQGANSGSAAHFFYCAKSSQQDRNDGLNDLPLRSAGEVTDRKDGSDGLNSPRAGAGRNSGSRCFHPTVKPTALMRYLVRLVTPPNGLILDPFCGAGSTGRAAMYEDFRFIGVELNEGYCQLAQRRIQAAFEQSRFKQEGLFPVEPLSPLLAIRSEPQQPAQEGLFATVAGE